MYTCQRRTERRTQKQKLPRSHKLRLVEICKSSFKYEPQITTDSKIKCYSFKNFRKKVSTTSQRKQYSGTCTPLNGILQT